jgi:hypothetical protein
VLTSQVNHFFGSNVSIVPSTLEYKPSLVGAIALVLARAFSVPSLGWYDRQKPRNKGAVRTATVQLVGSV